MDLSGLGVLPKKASYIWKWIQYWMLCQIRHNFLMEMVEGEDRPQEIWAKEFAGYSKTAGLMMRMLKTYFCTGKYVILDSGFCVFKALIELNSHCLFACALIKKHHFWPAQVPGFAMDEQIAGSNPRLYWRCYLQPVGNEIAQLCYEDDGNWW